MIFDKIDNLTVYEALSERFCEAAEFLKKTDLKQLPMGKTEIDGENVYINKMTAELKGWEDRTWEAHRKYIDIHVLVEGKETLGIRSTDGMEITVPYDESNDCFFGDKNNTGDSVSFSCGEFIVCFPWDAHRVGISRDNCSSSVRCVVKIKI